MPLSLAASHSGVKLGPSGSMPRPLNKRVARERVGRHQIHQSEAPRIGVADGGAVFEMEDDMLVLRRIALRMREAARFLSRAISAIDREATAHAEMHDQHLAVVEPGKEIFRAPVERLDLSPGQPLAEALGQGKAQIGPPLLDPRERVADQDRLKSPSHGLNLRKFWHGAHIAMRKKLRCAATIA